MKRRALYFGFLGKGMLKLLPLLLTILPWTPLFRRPRRVQRVLFAPFFLVADRRAVRKRRLREIALAALRSLAIAILVLLWNLPTPAPTPTASAESAPAPRTPSRLLIVDGADSGPDLYPTPIDAPSVADYLAWALDDSKIDVDRIDSAELASLSLAALRRYDALVLADLSVPTDAELEKLTEYASNERFVLAWSGPRTSPERWTEVWKKMGLDAVSSLEEFNKAPKRFVSPSPLAQIFPDASAARLDALPVDRAVVTSGADAAPLLSDSGTGTPTFSRLNPHWYWFAPSPDPNDGALALAPYFITLVEKVLEFPSVDLSAPQSLEDNAFDWRPVLWLALALIVFAELALAEPRRRKAQQVFPNRLV